MTILREISLKNGQILKSVMYAGTKEEFEKAYKTDSVITLERQEVVPADKITVHLRTNSIVYYVFSNA